MKRKAKPSKSSKKGSSSRGSRAKRSKTGIKLPRESCAPSSSDSEYHSDPEHYRLNDTRPRGPESARLPRELCVSDFKDGTDPILHDFERTGREKYFELNGLKRKSTNSEKGSEKISANEKIETSLVATETSDSAKDDSNGEKKSSSRRRSKSPSSDLLQSYRRRSSRRSEGAAPELVSLSYIYPGKMDWDSFRNCWVKKGTAAKAKPKELATKKSTAKSAPAAPTVKVEPPAPLAEEKKELERKSKAVEETKEEAKEESKEEAVEEAKEESKEEAVEEAKEEDSQPVINDGDENEKDSRKLSPPTDEAEKETKETDEKTSVEATKDNALYQFADPDEDEDSVEVASKTAALKGDENDGHGSDKQSPSAPETNDSNNSAVDKDTTEREKNQETIVVNPADVNINDFCFVCRLDGDLMECFAELENGTEAGCGKSIHIGCIGRAKIPSKDWLCSQCARKQGLQIKPGEHPQYGYAFGEDEFEVENGTVVIKLSLGSRIAVFWRDDRRYYNATVVNHYGESNVEVLYDDGVRESLDLSDERYKVLPNDDTAIGSSEIPKSADEERKVALLGPNDIVVGRGDSQKGWANQQHGYHVFRKLLNTYHTQYEALSNNDTSDRRTLCKKVYSELDSMNFRFVSWDGNGWKQLAYSKGVDKVNQGLRDFRVGSVLNNGNEKDERGLRWNDVPLGYSTKKGLAYRPGYQTLRRIVRSMEVEFKASDDKRVVCSKVLNRLAKEDVRIVRIVKKDGGDDWVQVEKEKAITRVFRAFQEESSESTYHVVSRAQGVMPSQQIHIPPLVSPKTRDRDRSKKIRSKKSRKRLPASNKLALDNRHPLIREDPSSKRVSVEIDPTFLVQSDNDSVASGSSDGSSESSIGSAMNQIDLYDEDFENANIKAPLVNLCSKIRVGHLAREDRPTSSHFDPAIGHESANYYYQPPPFQRITKFSYQHDMICDLMYSGPPGKPPMLAAAHRNSRYGSHHSVPKRSSNVTARGVAWSPPPVQATRPTSQVPRALPKVAPTSAMTAVYPHFAVAGALAAATYGRLPPPPPPPPPPPIASAIGGSSRKRGKSQSPRKKRKKTPNLGSPNSKTLGKPQLSAHAIAVLGKAAIADNDDHPVRFRNYQVETWTARLQEAQEFRRKHGHCIIPHDYPENQELARWAKRQRYQYQLYKNNSAKSSMTTERVKVLEQLGFCWEHKSTIWHKRYAELKGFMKEYGHTLVPTNFWNRKLASWVKCQRRQMRLLEKGSPNTLNDERVTLLNAVQFAWNINSADIPDIVANTKPMATTAAGRGRGGANYPGSSSGEEDDDEEYDYGYDEQEEEEAPPPPGPPGMGLEERKIRAKYLKKNTSASSASAAASLPPGIGEEEMKIREKYKKTTNFTEIGEEELKIWAKYKGI
ncbi:unnamed protein product [Cylindrotheca closterium]|uniref:PHD-type domain-containing protein n=1 Tax=Cylindrotheca closterium TaxID=2856 RepID=A0AAD2FWN8_9STRA|nr:unnamed protein product [Cylindrotheca closterium]